MIPDNLLWIWIFPICFFLLLIIALFIFGVSLKKSKDDAIIEIFLSITMKLINIYVVLVVLTTYFVYSLFSILLSSLFTCIPKMLVYLNTGEELTQEAFMFIYVFFIIFSIYILELIAKLIFRRFLQKNENSDLDRHIESIICFSYYKSFSATKFMKAMFFIIALFISILTNFNSFQDLQSNKGLVDAWVVAFIALDRLYTYLTSNLLKDKKIIYDMVKKPIYSVAILWIIICGLLSKEESFPDGMDEVDNQQED